MLVHRYIIEGMIAGHYYLDILIDPFSCILRLRRSATVISRFVNSRGRDVPDLSTGLSQLETNEPWRAQYRSSPVNHPDC